MRVNDPFFTYLTRRPATARVVFVVATHAAVEQMDAVYWAVQVVPMVAGTFYYLALSVWGYLLVREMYWAHTTKMPESCV